MKIKVSEVEVGQIVLIKDKYLMRTDSVHVGDDGFPETNDAMFVSKDGKAFIYYFDEEVETDIPWYEQVDGFRVLYLALFDAVKVTLGLKSGPDIKNERHQEEYNKFKGIK